MKTKILLVNAAVYMAVGVWMVVTERLWLGLGMMAVSAFWSFSTLGAIASEQPARDHQRRDDQRHEQGRVRQHQHEQ